MLTPLGQQIRRLRLTKGVKLKEMADAFKVKSSFLSAVENGRKAMPEDWVAMLDSYFVGCGVNRSTWRELAELSKPKITINMAGADAMDRETILAFGRNYLTLPPDKKSKIRKIFE